MNLLDMITALKAGENTDWSVVRPEKLEQIRTHAFYAEPLQALRKLAEQDAATPIPTVRYSLFKLFDEVGSRIEFQDVYVARRAMLIHFFMEALLNGKFISELEDMIWSTCDEYSWCLTAHFWYGGTHIPAALNEKEDGKGLIRSSYREQAQHIDLCNATTGAALAEITYLLEDKLSPAVVYRARKEVRRRVLEPFMELNEPFTWEYAVHNWGAVCAGNIGMAAMYLIPESTVLAPVLTRCYGTMECYLRGFLEDGVCTEGLGYWNYGFSSFMMFADLLKRRTAGQIDLFQNEKVHKVALFQQNSYLVGKNSVCFADCGSTARYYYLTTHYLKSIYPDVVVPNPGELPDMLANREYTTMMLREFLWSNPDYVPTDIPDGDVVFAQSQWGVTHATVDGKKMAFAIKGGHNDEPHNHNDIGSFLFDVEGEVLVGDVGGGLYNKEYFSDKRYTLLVTGSHGHPVPIIGGMMQKAGKEHCAKDFAYTYDDEKSVYTADLAPAYAIDSVEKVLRTVTFCKECGSLQVQDDITFADAPMSVTERFVTKFPAKADGNDMLVVGEKNTLRLHAENGTWSLSEGSYTRAARGGIEDDGKVKVNLLDANAVDPAKPVVVTMSVKL